MPDEHDGHHEIVVQSKSLIANEKLLKVDERGEPHVVSVIEVPESAELNSHPSVLLIS